MLTVEELLDITLIEEGQYLLGEEFITETLGFSMDKIHKIFVKSMKEYARRRPITETKVIQCDEGSAGSFHMPKGTLNVRAIRYDMLDDYPRTLFPEFGQINYEFDPHTLRLRTFPPMSALRITYSREYNMSDSANIEAREYLVDYETEAVVKVSCTPRKKSINVIMNGKGMKEVGIETKLVEDNTGTRNKRKYIKLEGDLGTGYYDTASRELEVRLKEGMDGDLIVSCTPLYPVITEMNIGFYAFTKLFKSYFLEALASTRAQATQQDLQNIDLTSDDLHGRAMVLKAEVQQLLRDTLDFGALAPI